MNRPKCVKRTDFGAMLIELAEHAIRGIPPKEYYWLDETNFVRKIIHCDMITRDSRLIIFMKFHSPGR